MRDASGKTVRDAAALAKDQPIEALLASGKVIARVERAEPETRTRGTASAEGSRDGS